MKAVAVFLPILLALSVIGVSIYGLVLAFQASILIGIIALIVEPAPLVIGLVALLTGTNLAEELAKLIF